MICRTYPRSLCTTSFEALPTSFWEVWVDPLYWLPTKGLACLRLWGLSRTPSSFSTWIIVKKCHDHIDQIFLIFVFYLNVDLMATKYSGKSLSLRASGVSPLRLILQTLTESPLVTNSVFWSAHANLLRCAPSSFWSVAFACWGTTASYLTIDMHRSCSTS